MAPRKKGLFGDTKWSRLPQTKVRCVLTDSGLCCEGHLFRVVVLEDGSSTFLLGGFLLSGAVCRQGTSDCALVYTWLG